MAGESTAKGFNPTEWRNAYGDIFGIFVTKCEFLAMLRDVTHNFQLPPQPVSKCATPMHARQATVSGAVMQAASQAELVSEVDRFRLGGAQRQ